MGIESSLKLLDYLGKVSKESIVLDGKPFGSGPVRKVTLNESFFHKDDCVMCGRCCLNETTAWTSEGVNRINRAVSEDFEKWGLDHGVIKEIFKRMKTHVVDINGKSVSFFVCDRDKTSEAFHLEWPDRKASPRCHWLFEKDSTYRCRVHPVRSVTCGMPHCRFFHNAKTHSTSIGVSQYGRNWALKCPVKFGEVNEESTQSRILWLERLYAVSKDCGIDTFLPEILDYLRRGNRSPAVFESTPRKKLFTVR